jgi:hypothetical protein
MQDNWRNPLVLNSPKYIHIAISSHLNKDMNNQI